MAISTAKIQIWIILGFFNKIKINLEPRNQLYQLLDPLRGAAVGKNFDAFGGQKHPI